MKKIMSVVALTSLVAAGSAMASGYRIPEQSLDSTAKAGANIASADKADVAYYNPAGMSLLEDRWQIEGTATYLYLSEIDYEDNRTPAFDGSSEEEHFLLPTFFVVSPDYNDFRFGFSLTETYGLQKRWKDQYASYFAQKFSLKVFELNPTVSYKFNDMFSVGAGVRMLYSEATVIKDNPPVPDLLPATTLGLDGDTTEWGYNLALDVKPSDNWNFAITYRSNVDLDFEDGDAVLNTIHPESGTTVLLEETTGNVTVPAPAVLTFSAAYTVDRWTIDLTVDQTYWSEYEELTFDFADSSMYLTDVTYDKDWDDTWAIRIGVEYELNPKITLLGGFAYDEHPVPDENLSFELPDSTAWLYSFGVRYKHSEQLEYGVAILYDYKEEGSRTNGDLTVDGDFSNASAFLVSFGLSYKF